MRKIAIRAIDLILNPLAQVAWLLLLISCHPAQAQKPAYYPPYKEAELLEAVPYVTQVIVVGHRNRHAEALGRPILYRPNNRLADYCGGFGEVMACTMFGSVIVIPARASKSTILHELGHIRDIHIEGRTWEESAMHYGWPRSY